jgi:hypothetical protein
LQIQAIVFQRQGLQPGLNPGAVRHRFHIPFQQLTNILPKLYRFHGHPPRVIYNIQYIENAVFQAKTREKPHNGNGPLWITGPLNPVENRLNP